MDVSGKRVVVTGGASGIGAALVSQFRAAGAEVFVFDLSGGPDAFECDVGDECALQNAIRQAQCDKGPIDIFVSNAGVMSRQDGGAASAPDEDWARCWSVNVMAHVYAARALLPSMISRGSGYFVNVASAAGLLNQIGDAAYSATKHAAVSFAESLAITHGSDGIGVSLVCPQYVATPMIGLSRDDADDRGSLLTADEVAICVLEAMRAERFMVLPHPEVAQFFRHRSGDHERWIGGMEALRLRAVARFGDSKPQRFYRLV